MLCYEDPEDVDYLMENVAIATVGDVMALKGENRIFVKQGLEMLKRTKNEGLKALIECTGIDPEYLNTSRSRVCSLDHVLMRAGDWTPQKEHWNC